LIFSAALAGAAEPSRDDLLAAGEKALAQGDAPHAALLFQRAGFIKHAADAEIGLTRAYMQGGEYRRALAFAAHTAGSHADSGTGKALYAQLLDLGGQTAIAARMQPIAAFSPSSPASASLPAGARAVSSGVLLDGGRTALSRASSLSEPLWVRNALGALVAARVLRRIDNLDVALLELERPIDGAALAAAPRDAFPGSPAFALEYPASEDAAPLWPLLRTGFVGRKGLGIGLPPGPRGGPVLDESGRLVGVALADRLVPVSLLRKELGAVLAETESRRITIDEIYERALAATLQVIAAR
jgi:hypothetical protein